MHYPLKLESQNHPVLANCNLTVLIVCTCVSTKHFQIQNPCNVFCAFEMIFLYTCYIFQLQEEFNCFTSAICKQDVYISVVTPIE